MPTDQPPVDLAAEDCGRERWLEFLPEGSPLVGHAGTWAITTRRRGNPGGEAVALSPRAKLESGDRRIASRRLSACRPGRHPPARFSPPARAAARRCARSRA